MRPAHAAGTLTTLLLGLTLLPSAPAVRPRGHGRRGHQHPGGQGRHQGRGQGDALRHQPAVRQERGEPGRLGHRVHAPGRPQVRARGHPAQGPADHQHHQPARAAPRRGLRLQDLPGRHPGVDPRRPGAGQLHRRRHRRRGGRHVAVRHRPQPAARRRRHRDRRPDPARAPQVGQLPAGRPRLAQHDDPPQRQVPLQLQLRPAHQHRAEHRHLRRAQPRAPQEGR